MTAAEQTPVKLEPLLPIGYQQSSMEPRFSPDGSMLIWISCDSACEAGTHYASASLHAMEWNGKGLEQIEGTTEIVPVIKKPGTSGGFPGLFSQNLAATLLPQKPFLGA